MSRFFIHRKSFVQYSFSFLLALGIFFFFQSCEKKSQPVLKKNNNTAEVKRLTILADDQFQKTEYDAAAVNYIKIVNLADTIKDRSDYIDALISLGYIYQYLGDYMKSEAVTTQILPSLKYMKKPRFAWNTYTILGSNYLETGDSEKAMFFYKKAQNLKNSEFRKLCSINNIALIYLKKREYKKALDLFLQVGNHRYYTETKSKENMVDWVITLSNVGLCYHYLKNPKALDYYQKALDISLKIKNRECLAKSYEGLAYYYSERNSRLSHHYALLCYKNACAINFASLKISALYALVYSSEGKDLKKYSELSTHLNDSIRKARKTTKTQFSHIKYDFKINKQQNQELKSQQIESEILLERQKNRNLISYIIIAAVLLVISFLTFYMHRLNKKTKRQTIYESEIRISNKLQNELSNIVYKLITYSQNTNLEIKEHKEDLLKQLDTIYQQTRKISKENSKISTDKNFETEVKEMISGFSNPKINLILNGLSTIPWNKIDKNKKVIVYRIIQELLSYRTKYNEVSLVAINFKVNSKSVSINYNDNATATESKFDTSTIKKRIMSIKGQMEIDPKNEIGIKIHIKFPL